MKLNTQLTVKDLIALLQEMPQDAKVVIPNYDIYNNGEYYVTRGDIEFYESDGEKQVEIGTNYKTQAL